MIIKKFSSKRIISFLIFCLKEYAISLRHIVNHRNVNKINLSLSYTLWIFIIIIITLRTSAFVSAVNNNECCYGSSDAHLMTLVSNRRRRRQKGPKHRGKHNCTRKTFLGSEKCLDEMSSLTGKASGWSCLSVISRNRV